MYEKSLEEMRDMSVCVGRLPDYTQGGGGNTSVKLSDELMAVKASGCKLSDMTLEDGFVVINYRKVREYYEKIDLNGKNDFYKESAQFVKDNMVKLNNIKEGRPSIEAGFHSLLYKYVIHTHSVYGNLLCCTKEGEKIAAELFDHCPYTYLWLPYIAPGFFLTLEIQKKIEEMGRIPNIVFMGSHGVIISDTTLQGAQNINEYVSSQIRERLHITEPYGDVKVKANEKGTFMSDTKKVTDLLKGSKKDAAWFDSNILYPDQAAYLLGAVSTDGSENKAKIDLKTGNVEYFTTYKEALTLDESICAFLFIMEEARKNGLHTYPMKDEDIAFIMGWEGEKYRKAMLNKK
ncbi:MAG: class II aldolase/adducin family protein [Clostridia bacterium]